MRFLEIDLAYWVSGLVDFSYGAEIVTGYPSPQFDFLGKNPFQSLLDFFYGLDLRNCGIWGDACCAYYS